MSLIKPTPSSSIPISPPPDFQPLGCAECKNGSALGFDFTMALQPIVDIKTRTVFAYEALVRGLGGEPAASVLGRVSEQNRYRFDQSCRVKAVELASRLGLLTYLSINFMPNAVYRPELCIRTTLEAAERYNFPTSALIFEFTEDEQLKDTAHLKAIVAHYRKQGFLTAIDDFGAGYARFDLLYEVPTDIVKFDMALTRNIDKDPRRRTIVQHNIRMLEGLSVRVVAEGIETRGEMQVLRDLGVDLMQGYYFAQPALERAELVDFTHLL
ncbi:MAG: EAL domain-containing protein [Serpentinimonas sp.]|nr:EAL domain-containing protein [Serpentinimonas sp.]